jgi:hypothetical protein
MANVLRESMMLFVMGHEYGHIIEGHLSDSHVTCVNENDRAQKVLQNWRREFDADAKGLELMAAAMNTEGYDIANSYWGADFFFSCMDVVEQSISILRIGEVNKYSSASDSHPTAWMRREKLRGVVTSSLPPDLARAPIQLGMILEQIITTLWMRTTPILHQCYEVGKNLSPIWG